ncbi:RNA polymerase sigma-70 factor [Carboxylicivirga marina]|uniref:RNA polymerase sigma-70 factor n=1 Tax=Carboxylicivirga marina TaxID=2800988 RepID=A0ABS1HG62_9BACT|nr:RNA polymerase sigma-70 factor [Carboxylicivirga marina]MBK3516626.1 RNA polymerase sigma-70 factor [Carboxylicivirga marina]
MKREDFKSLFNEQFDPLRNYIYYRCGDAELATDIAQDVFMKLWEKKLDKPPKELIGLLYKMAKDAFISKYRRSKTEQEFIARPPDNAESQSPEEELNYKELKRTYERALKEMPEIQREVFMMSRVEELKYHEIAERLELSIKAVEKRMKNALQFLRQELAVQ